MSPELTKMIDGFRIHANLEPKGEFVSNFVLESPDLEIHILAEAFDEMRSELSKKSSNAEAAEIVHSFSEPCLQIH